MFVYLTVVPAVVHRMRLSCLYNRRTLDWANDSTVSHSQWCPWNRLRNVALVALIAVLKAELWSTVCFMVERLRRPDGKIPIPRSTLGGQMQTFGTANLWAVFLDVMFDCVSDSFPFAGCVTHYIKRLESSVHISTIEEPVRVTYAISVKEFVVWTGVSSKCTGHFHFRSILSCTT